MSAKSFLIVILPLFCCVLFGLKMDQHQTTEQLQTFYIHEELHSIRFMALLCVSSNVLRRFAMWYVHDF